MIVSTIVQALLHVWICPPAFSAMCGVLCSLYAVIAVAVIVVSILPRSIVARLHSASCPCLCQLNTQGMYTHQLILAYPRTEQLVAIPSVCLLLFCFGIRQGQLVGLPSLCIAWQSKHDSQTALLASTSTRSASVLNQHLSRK